MPELIPVDHDPFAPFAPTVLPPEDEAKFRRDMAEKPEYKAWSDSFRQRFGEQPNLNDPQYDYRGAWQGGIVPQPYAPDQGFPHWPSALPSGQMLKAPADHPTAWMEHFMQQYGVDPNLASPDVIDAGRKSGIVPEGWRGSRLIPVDHDPFASVGLSGDQVQVPPQNWRLPDLAALTGIAPALEQSAAASAAHPWQPGMTAGQMLAGRPEDPLSQSFGVGTIGRGGPKGLIASDVAKLDRLQALEAENAAPEMGGFVRRLEAEQAAQPAAQPVGFKVYHASPYDFERFDMSKVNTGQGAQSFGYGLYTAESPKVSGAGGEYDRQFTLKNLGKSDFNQGEEQVFRGLAAGKSDLDILGDLARGGGYTFDEAMQTLDRMKAAKAKIYENWINADPEHFLDWDKPLSGQPPAARQFFDLIYSNPRVSGEIPTGKDLYDAIARKEVNADWGPPGEMAQSLASARLREAGIPGIRYLDQGSRNPGFSSLMPAQLEARINSLRADIEAGGGDQQRMRDQLSGLERERETYRNQTHNYVVFDDKLIDIIKKYGLAGLIAGGAATVPGAEGNAHMIPVEHDPFAP